MEEGEKSRMAGCGTRATGILVLADEMGKQVCMWAGSGEWRTVTVL